MATARASKPVEPAIVAGKGHDKAGRVVYGVTSKSEPGRWHLVTIDSTVYGARLTCDCRAAQFGRDCRHRVAVAERIAAERQMYRDLAHEQNAACCGY